MKAKGPASVVIREEERTDHEQVFEVNAQAFETDLEANLVESLRRRVDPLLSLVALVDERVVGHILFTPVTVEGCAKGGAALMGLGPMAVLPECQNRGIGSRLVEEGLARCRALGTEAVVVLGHADYYPRFGFEPAKRFALRYKSEELDPYFMVLELRPGALETVSGDVHYSPEFD
ncbi:MAG: N-acetyltransferase [Thermoanaerobaculia bacterium]